MSAEVNTVLAQIATIQREIVNPVTGKNLVSFDNIPYTITLADAPLFITFVGQLNQNNQVGSDNMGREFLEIRNYVMNLYHSGYGTGAEQEKSGLLTPYFPLVYEKFGEYPHLKNLAGAVDARLIIDTGMKVIPFNGQSYYGIGFTLQVKTKVRRLLGEAE